MDITVINGTEKHGVTYRLKEMFLAEFKDKASITEYDLPKDCPNFCKNPLPFHSVCATISPVDKQMSTRHKHIC